MAFDSFLFQSAMKPEAIETRSWMTTMGKDFLVRANAFCFKSENRASNPATSPARTECFDIFSPEPGDSDVMSQIERLSSKETKIAARSVWIAVDGSA